MTKEEYVKELEKQFEEEETLIPEPQNAPVEQTTDENAAPDTQTATEAQSDPAPAADTATRMAAATRNHLPFILRWIISQVKASGVSAEDQVLKKRPLR